MNRQARRRLAAIGLAVFIGGLADLAAPVSADARAGNRLLSKVVRKSGGAKIATFYASPGFMNKTRRNWAALDLGYKGSGTLSILSATYTPLAGGPPVSAPTMFAITTAAHAQGKNKLIFAGTPNTTPVHDTLEYTVVVSDGAGATSTVSVPIVCCGYSVGSWADFDLAYKTNTALQFTDRIRWRWGSYAGADNSITRVSNTAILPGPNGEGAPLNRQSPGWVVLEPDAGYTLAAPGWTPRVTFTGRTRMAGTAGVEYNYLRIRGLRFLSSPGEYGVPSGEASGALQHYGGAVLRYTWLEGNEFAAPLNATGYANQMARWVAAGSLAAPTGGYYASYGQNTLCAPNCKPGVNNYMYSALQEGANGGLADLWVTDNWISAGYDGIQLAGSRIRLIGNLLENNYRDAISGRKSDSDVAFNIITNKAAVGGAHGDYYQENFNNQGGGYLGNRVVGNLFYPGVGDGSPPGQFITTNVTTQNASGVTTVRSLITGAKYYGNFFQGEHVAMLALSNCTSCTARWNTIVYGTSKLTSNQLTISMKTFSGTNPATVGGISPWPLVLDGNNANYNVARAVAADGTNADVSKNVTYTSNLAVDEPLMFANPIHDGTDDPAVIQSRWAPLANGKLSDTGAANTAAPGICIGAICSGYINYTTREGAWPDGFTYNGNTR